MDKMTGGKWFTAYNYHSDIPGRAMVQIRSDAPVDSALFDYAIIGEAAIAAPADGLHPASVIEAEANARLFAASKTMLDALRHMYEVSDIAPEPNCSCHLSAPCGDCVEWFGMREARRNAALAIEEATGERL